MYPCREPGKERSNIVSPKEVAPPEERAVLVGAPTKDVETEIAEEHLNELAELADTAGASVVDRVRQRIDKPTPK